MRQWRRGSCGGNEGGGGGGNKEKETLENADLRPANPTAPLPVPLEKSDRGSAPPGSPPRYEPQLRSRGKPDASAADRDEGSDSVTRRHRNQIGEGEKKKEGW